MTVGKPEERDGERYPWPTLFAGLSKRVDLRLVSRLELGSGAVAMRHEPSGGGPMGRPYALRTSRTGVVNGISDGPNVAGSARPNAQEAVAGWTADGCPLTSVIVQDSS